MRNAGHLSGHWIPGFAFLLVGVSLLSQTLLRARFLQPGQSYCESFVPEHDFRFLKAAAFSILVVVTIGILLEGFGGCVLSYTPLGLGEGCFFVQMDHEVLYFDYGCIAFIIILEIHGLLPADSWRAMNSLSSALASILWYEHAMMKTDAGEKNSHLLMALIVLLHAVVNGYSVLYPKHFGAFLFWQVLYVIKAAWLITLGYSMGIREIPNHRVSPLFVFEVLSITMSVLCIFAFCGQPFFQGSISDKVTMSRSLPRTAVYAHLQGNGSVEDEDFDDSTNNTEP